MPDIALLDSLISEFLVPLRMRDGIQNAAAGQLAEYLEELVSDYREETLVPKRVAFLLHELMNGIEAALPLYGAPDNEQIGRELLRFDGLITDLYTD